MPISRKWAKKLLCNPCCPRNTRKARKCLTYLASVFRVFRAVRGQRVISMTNIFANIPDTLPEELFTSLLKQDKVQIERIVSKGHSTPDRQWYDQAQDEWVIVLQGQAVLAYEHQKLTLMTGDYVFIPAHTRHRVEWTAPDINTVWLAIHFYE